MKKMIFTALVACSAIIANAQGIKFEQGQSWQQIRDRAKAERKYVFVDCYATWCGPCKAMDQTVYPDEKVGAAMNDRFLSVKIQFDETPKDSKEVKKWHETAVQLNKDYKLQGYPSFLFFDPEGKLLYRGLGQTDAEGFIKMATFALTDPAGKLRERLTDYQQGRKDYVHLPDLIKAVSEKGDKALVKEMQKDYIDNYLYKLSEDKLLTRDNVVFLANADMVSSKDRFFELLNNEPGKVDSLFHDPDLCNRFIDGIVAREELDNKLFTGGKVVARNPDWTLLEETIHKKYPKINEKGLVKAYQLGFYWRVGAWKQVTDIMEDNHKKNKADAGTLNQDAWALFQSCNDKEALEKALAWSEESMKLSDNLELFDTHANLLYKMGRKKEAMEQEQGIIDKVKAMPEGREKDILLKEFTGNINKMRNGEPTWPLPAASN